MGLAHAVVTAVARDDLADGGAAAFAATIGAIRRRTPRTAVEVLIPDCKGDAGARSTPIFAAAPDVLNHNIETVARLQRAVRPSACYARSLAVLARAKARRTHDQVRPHRGHGRDRRGGGGRRSPTSRGVGVDIVTIGQYLRPTAHHLPVARWVPPDEFDALQDGRRGDGHRPRRGVAADPLELPRQAAAASAAAALVSSAPRSPEPPARLAAWERSASLHLAALRRVDHPAARVLRRATAPQRRSTAHINVSPKGLDTFRVLGPNHGRVPRPHRQWRRDDRPCSATTGAITGDVLRVRRATSHRRLYGGAATPCAAGDRALSTERQSWHRATYPGTRSCVIVDVDRGWPTRAGTPSR